MENKMTKEDHKQETQSPFLTAEVDTRQPRRIQ